MRINRKIRKVLPRQLRKLLDRNKTSTEFRNVYWSGEEVIEFFLLDFNEDLDKAWVKINALYNRILYKDPNWHFFWEGKYSIIRCSQEFEEEVTKFFKEFDIQYKYNGLWVDGSEMVCKYHKIFQPMFHCFSELAIHMDEPDLFDVADRVTHCFFNHAHYMAKDHREPFKHPYIIDPMMWEATMMARLSVYRALHIGKYTMEGYLRKASEEQEEKSKNKEEPVVEN